MKKLTAFLTTFLTVFTPSIALAIDPAGWAAKTGLSLLTSAAKAFVLYFGLYVKAILIPHGWWGVLLIGLTIIWMLGIPQIRKQVGRLSGLFWAIFIGLAAIKTTIHIFYRLPGLARFLLVVFVILFFTIAIIPVKLLWGRLKSLATSTIHGNEMNWVACIAGAVFCAGLLNGSYFSRPGNFYAPSIVSNVIGSILLVVYGFKLYRHKWGRVVTVADRSAPPTQGTSPDQHRADESQASSAQSHGETAQRASNRRRSGPAASSRQRRGKRRGARV